MKNFSTALFPALIMIFLSVVFSCSDAGNQLPNYGIGDALTKCKIGNEKELISSIRYVPLETSDSCLISEPLYFSLYLDKIVIADSKHNVFLFDTTGKFVKRIGIKGKGPGEYQTIFGYSFDHSTGNIHLSSPQNTIVYNINGDYIKKLNFKFDFESMLVDDGKYIVTKPAFQFPDKTARSVIEIYSENGDAIKKIDYRGEIGEIPYFTMIYYKNGYTYYREELSDTLLRFGKDMSPVPFAVLGLKDFLVTPANFRFASIPEAEKCYRIFKMFDFDDKTIFNMQNGFMSFSKITSFVYLKKSEEIVCIGDHNGKGGFYIDSLYHNPVTADDSRLLCLISYKDLTGLKRDQIINHSLLNVTKNISENSNPVLSLVTLK